MKIEKGIKADVFGKPAPIKDFHFLKVFPAFFYSFLKVLGVEDGRARLVLYFMYKAQKEKVDGDNCVMITNNELMKALKISKPTLIKYINNLIETGFIKRLYPRTPLYALNPNMVYKGSLKNYDAKYFEIEDQEVNNHAEN